MPPAAEEHKCRWGDCDLPLFPDAESLYEHITSTHIGRKSSGTLSLECRWVGCTSKASKRDHLTSHTRVHINLKPHSCEICSKSFKRPQDLKKHEKIHTEEHHATHKHSKAVTTNGVAPSTRATEAKGESQAQPTSAANSAAAAQAYNDKLMQGQYGGGYPGYSGYPYFGQHPLYAGHPGLPQLDVAQLIEHQRQMNAHVVSAAYGLQTPYGIPGFGAPNGYPSSQPGMPMFSAGMPQPFPYPYFPHGMQYPPQQPLPPTSTPLTMGSSSPSAPPPPTPNSMYPSLTSLGPGSLYPTLSPSQVKSEDADSPLSGFAPSPASTLSPKVPSLSPSSASNGYSPGPDEESLFSASRSTNAVAGQKRAFEDAAEDFFNDIKNKRLHDDDYKSQVESIDALSLLLTPNDFQIPAMQQNYRPVPATSQNAYNPSDVEHINEILANLAQNIDELEQQPPSHASNGYTESLARSHAHHHSTTSPVHAGNMYPSLSSFERPLAPLPSRSNHLSPSGGQYESHYGSSGLASIRLAKSPAAPSIAADESRYHHGYLPMDRLTRAAPSMSYRSRASTMDVDDDEVETSSRSPFQQKGYATSLRSTSMDDDSDPVIQLPPIKSPSSLQPASGTTLPHIRDMLNFAPGARESPSPSPLYPSISDRHSSPSSSSTPVTSPRLAARSTSFNGPMERLVPHFTKISMAPSSSCSSHSADLHDEPEELDDVIEHEQLAGTPSSDSVSIGSSASDSDTDETERHTVISKKSRVAGDDVADDIRKRRLAVLKALVVHLNDAFRTQVALQAQAQMKKDFLEREQAKMVDAAPSPVAASS